LAPIHKIEYVFALRNSATDLSLSIEQGDQIGRIFDHWVIFYFGQSLKIAEIYRIFGLLYYTVKVMH
jgi:hypothetical protein